MDVTRDEGISGGKCISIKCGFICIRSPELRKNCHELGMTNYNKISQHRMGKLASPYEEGEIIDGAEHTAFECGRWQSYRSELTSTIVGIMIASRENWASVANYVERILILKKRDLEAAKHVGVLA